MAIREPTDRSMPPVAMTRVIPVATITMGATWVRLTYTLSVVRNRSVKTAL
jgi:hypothetical protein